MRRLLTRRRIRRFRVCPPPHGFPPRLEGASVATGSGASPRIRSVEADRVAELARVPGLGVRALPASPGCPSERSRCAHSARRRLPAPVGAGAGAPAPPHDAPPEPANVVRTPTFLHSRTEKRLDLRCSSADAASRNQVLPSGLVVVHHVLPRSTWSFDDMSPLRGGEVIESGGKWGNVAVSGESKPRRTQAGGAGCSSVPTRPSSTTSSGSRCRRSSETSWQEG